jgi:transcription initiation factor TFIIIB Brf1 subunit/transcription initiation factor TFIIB
LKLEEILCQHFDLKQRLKPLLNYDRSIQSSDYNTTDRRDVSDLDVLKNRLQVNKSHAKEHTYKLEKLTQRQLNFESKRDNYLEVQMNQQSIVFQRLNFKVNCSQILRVVDKKDSFSTRSIRQETSNEIFDMMRDERIKRIQRHICELSCCNQFMSKTRTC